jgi:membrane dipeptidase
MRTPQQLRIFDGHNDVISRIAVDGFVAGDASRHLDLPRARGAGFAGGLFATFVLTESAAVLPHDRARREVMTMLRRLREIEDRAADRFALCRNTAEIDAAVEAGKLAAVWHCEGAEIVDPSLSDLDEYYQAGLRSLGLVWNRTNAFAQGVGPANTGDGLSSAGRALVRRCNELGIVVDLSHLNEPGFTDVARCSEQPLVASHSNARALCDHPRNLTDDQLRIIRRTDGVVGINFYVAFLQRNGTSESVGIDAIVDHAAYIADRIGIEHVGLGSDFDGADIPTELADVTGLPTLLSRFADRGFDTDAIHRIAWANWQRVLRRTWGG